MDSGKYKPSHEYYDDSMPEIDRIWKPCDDVKHMIIEPFSDISGMWYGEHKDCYENSCKGESMRTMEESIVEITCISNHPEKNKQSNSYKTEAYII